MSLAVWRNLLPNIFQGGLQPGSPSRRAAPGFVALTTRFQIKQIISLFWRLFYYLADVSPTYSSRLPQGNVFNLVNYMLYVFNVLNIISRIKVSRNYYYLSNKGYRIYLPILAFRFQLLGGKQNYLKQIRYQLQPGDRNK